MKVSIYYQGAFGYSCEEVNLHSMQVRSYAQYRNAVEVRFKASRQRLMRARIRVDGMIVLAGWGHIQPPCAFESLDGGGSESRYSCFDERYGREFDAMIDQYVAEKGVQVLIDARSGSKVAALAHGPISLAA